MIPKTIHLCWLSGDAYPPLIQQCIDSWAKFLPDYNVRLWSAADIADTFPPWVEEAYTSRKYAFAADFVRLFALYTEGGVYLDADVEVCGSLDGFLHLRSFMGTETGGDLEPAIIGSVPGLPWVKACLEYYDGRHFLDEDGNKDTRPLPIIIREVLEQQGLSLKGAVDSPVSVNFLDLTIYPSDYFSPKNRHSGIVESSPRTISVHHFDGQWVDKNFGFYVKKFVHASLFRLFGEERYISIRDYVRKS